MSDRFKFERALTRSALPSKARHLLLTLAIYADWPGGVTPKQYTPSLSTLQKATGFGHATVLRMLLVAEQAGWLTRHRPEIWNARANKERTQYALSVPVGLGPQPTMPEVDKATAGLGDEPELGPPWTMARSTMDQELGPPWTTSSTSPDPYPDLSEPAASPSSLRSEDEDPIIEKPEPTDAVDHTPSSVQDPEEAPKAEPVPTAVRTPAADPWLADPAELERQRAEKAAALAEFVDRFGAVMAEEPPEWVEPDPPVYRRPERHADMVAAVWGGDGP